MSSPFETVHQNLRSRSIMLPTEGLRRATAGYYLKSITIYPIKSCAGFGVDSWPLSSTELLHDREWLLKSVSGDILTQKKVPEMCYISTSIDLTLGILCVDSPRCKEKLHISLVSDSLFAEGGNRCIFAEYRYKVHGYGNEIDTWFSNAVGRCCSLLRRSSYENFFCSSRSGSTGMCRDVDTRLNLVNEAQLLLISEESVSDLNTRLSANVQKGFGATPIRVNPTRFRPNLVISGGNQPYEEDGWKNLKIGNKYFTSLGGCNRVQMINLNPQVGEVQRSTEPLSTLAAYRRVKGKIYFEILLRFEDTSDVRGKNRWGRDRIVASSWTRSIPQCRLASRLKIVESIYS